MICDFDCLNCKYEDCVNDDIPENELCKADEIVIKGSEELEAREIKNRKQRELYHKNVGKRRAYAKEQRKKHLDKVKESQHKWYLNHKEYVREKNKKYQEYLKTKK